MSVPIPITVTSVLVFYIDVSAGTVEWMSDASCLVYTCMVVMLGSSCFVCILTKSWSQENVPLFLLLLLLQLVLFTCGCVVHCYLFLFLPRGHRKGSALTTPQEVRYGLLAGVYKGVLRYYPALRGISIFM